VKKRGKRETFGKEDEGDDNDAEEDDGGSKKRKNEDGSGEYSKKPNILSAIDGDDEDIDDNDD
jgi:hypothetical protein